MSSFVQRNYEYILLVLTGLSLLVLVLYIATTSIEVLPPLGIAAFLGVTYVPLTLLYARARTRRLREIEAVRRARVEPYWFMVEARFQQAVEDIRCETPTLSDFDRAYMIQKCVDALETDLNQRNSRYTPPI